MRALACAWLVFLTIAIVLHERALRIEHRHANDTRVIAQSASALSTATDIHLHGEARRIAERVAVLEKDWKGQLAKLCATLRVIARTVPNRAELPADGRELCPDLEQYTAGARQPLRKRRP